MIVELYGLPTSGKTTLAARLVARLIEAGVAARLATANEPTQIARLIRRLTKLRDVFCALTFVSGPAGDARHLLSLFPQNDRWRAIRLWQYLIHLRSLYASAAGRNEVLVLDQGALQAIFSLVVCGSFCSDECLEDALDKVPQPDLLVTLDTSPSIVAERLRTRCSRTQLASRNQLAITLARDDAAFRGSLLTSGRIMRAAEARGWSISTMSSSGDFDHLVSMVMNRLDEAIVEGLVLPPEVSSVENQPPSGLPGCLR